MPRSAKAVVEPALLKWARHTARTSLDEAARRIGVQPARLASWENGTDAPTVVQLRKAARVYRRPFAVFYLPEPPTEVQPLQDFRRLPEAMTEDYSRELAFEVRHAHEVRDAALDLAEATERSVPRAWSQLKTDGLDPEDIASHIRTVLDITVEKQRSWRSPQEALKNWITAVETQGILVLQSSGVSLVEMRGFSVSLDPLPIIVLNGGDYPRPRIFTLLHELAHIASRASGLCDMHEAGTTYDIEPFCNAVAASVLMPKAAILAHPEVAGAPPQYEGWQRHQIQNVARDFAASEEAVLRRLNTLGKTTREFYLRGRDEIRLEFERERAHKKATGGSGGPPPHILVMRNLGSTYVNLAVNAYERGAINLASLSTYLGVKVPQVARIRQEVARRYE